MKDDGYWNIGLNPAVGRSLLDISTIGRAEGKQRLPHIWQKVVHVGKGAIMLKKCLYLK
jgi:hypothetical protein